MIAEAQKPETVHTPATASVLAAASPPDGTGRREERQWQAH